MLIFFIFIKLFCYEILRVMILIILLKIIFRVQNLFSIYIYYSRYGICDKINSLLLILIIYIFILRFLSSNLVDRYTRYFYNFIIVLILISLCFLFFSSSFLSLYIYFEFRILPIFLLIIGWGYQTERVSARLALIFYTMSASMPLLIFIIIIRFYKNIFYFSQFRFRFSCNYMGALFLLRVRLAFLIKLPIFLAHLWLPKAHVEAPVVGSIILASILLKLGGYGLIRVLPLIRRRFILNFIISISLSGSALIGFICLNQLDLKVVIAYSSVAHIGLVIGRLLYISNIRLIGGLILIIAHGLRSSAIFFGGNLLYLRRFSRRVIIRKGMLGTSPLISFIWLLTIIRRIAAPPIINLAAEIICISRIIRFSLSNILWIRFSVFLAGAYSLILYSRTQQSNFFRKSINLKFSRFNERVILFSHIFWMLVIILSLNLFIGN